MWILLCKVKKWKIYVDNSKKIFLENFKSLKKPEFMGKMLDIGDFIQYNQNAIFLKRASVGCSHNKKIS